MKNSIKRIFIIIIILTNIGCDQVSKNIVQKKVIPGDYIHILDDNFILTNVENTGAAMGLGQNWPTPVKFILLKIIPVLVLLFLCYKILKNNNKNKWLTISFAFIIGGGIGNLLDRFIYGSVTDFFFIKIGVLRTGVFNMADVSVTLGALLILFLTLSKKNGALTIINNDSLDGEG